MPATIQLEHVQQAGDVIVPVTAVRFRNDDTSAMDSSSPITLPADVQAITRDEIAGLSEPGEIQIMPTVSAFITGDFAIVEAGSSRQEVVLMEVDEADPTKIRAVFRRKHALGALLQKVIAAYSKLIRMNITMRPPSGAGHISNVKFCRTTDLPAGIYDQWRVMQGPGGVASTNVPWVSDAIYAYPSSPRNPTLIYGGPMMSTGPVPAMVEIQWLYTARGVPSTVTDPALIEEFLALAPAHYRFSWDEL